MKGVLFKSVLVRKLMWQGNINGQDNDNKKQNKFLPTTWRYASAFSVPITHSYLPLSAAWAADTFKLLAPYLE